MAPTDQETEVVPPAQEPEEMPLPSDPKVIFLGGLFVLALLAAAYVASEIVLPLAFAIILKLLLQPVLRILEGLHVPRMLAALLLILVLFGTIVGLGTAISGPAGIWAAKLPEGIPRLQERLSENPSIHCNGFCSRWKILEEPDRHQMRPPRREAQLF
jgi:predicted PurR-regulated permease PerM